MRIKLNINVPTQKDTQNKYHSLIEKCDDYIIICEGDSNSEYHFRYLNCVYKKLSQCRRLSPDMSILLDTLHDFMLKYNTDRQFLDGIDLLRNT